MSSKSKLAAILLFALLTLLPLNTHIDLGKGEYTYYGVVPSRIYVCEPKHRLHGAIDITAGFKIDPMSLRKTALLAIAGFNDDTNVRLYILKNKEWKLETEFTINRMEKKFYLLPNGTIFKVVTNNLALVLLLSSLPSESLPTPKDDKGPLPMAYYYSTEGSYIGKEFIILASQDVLGEPYCIFALEPAEVTITGEDGQKQSFKMEANSGKRLHLKAFKLYHIKSTGNIMIQSGGPGGMSYFIPSASGGYVGKRFYTITTGSFDKKADYGFRICAWKDTKVKIWDLAYKRLIKEVSVKAGEAVNIKPEAAEPDYVMAVESDKPISFMFVHSGDIKRSYAWSYGRGVNTFFVRPNEEVSFFLATNSTVKAYVFAVEDTQVMIDDVPITIKKDSFFVITSPGLHRIRSDKGVSIQLIQRPLIPQNPPQGVGDFGIVVLSPQLAEITPPKVKLSPIAGGGGMPMNLIMAGVAVVVIAAALGFIMMRRRK